jgi:hypothetical protein
MGQLVLGQGGCSGKRLVDERRAGLQGVLGWGGLGEVLEGECVPRRMLGVCKELFC